MQDAQVWAKRETGLSTSVPGFATHCVCRVDCTESILLSKITSKTPEMQELIYSSAFAVNQVKYLKILALSQHFTRFFGSLYIRLDVATQPMHNKKTKRLLVVADKAIRFPITCLFDHIPDGYLRKYVVGNYAVVKRPCAN